MTLKRGPKFNRVERETFVNKLRNLLKDNSLTIKEASEQLGVSLNYAYRVAKSTTCLITILINRRFQMFWNQKRQGLA